ncbi:squalene/phytoene synthase family protein [Silvanigrella aquatica]|uniref:Phytoene synthase n=1 Tax=Silvanigrella aquatica TaxID=1915309 RepID=A0A1L4D1I5_9BACT|nr:squalene/phytoene synthase family protein [Silvanigrella aquatica]APJ04062.1 hypothetical protein AXG55_09145 [Silvanigrella aquatica]
MNILEMKNSKILKIENQSPLIFSAMNEKTQYEWFYIEIFHENSHIVCILSLNDCFEIKGDNQQVPSVYITWHQNNSITAYSYSFYKGNEKELFISKIISWIKKETPLLDLWIPDHSLEKYIHFTLQLPIDIQENENFDSLRLNEKGNHFWQFLKYGNNAQGAIELFTIKNNNSLAHKVKRFSDFYDYPLKYKLQKNQIKRCVFQNATIYFDHNAGFESLYNLKDHWYWWHAKQNEQYEVAYYFPKLSSMYYVSGGNNTLTTQILDAQEKNVTLKKALSIFGVSYPKKIKSLLFKEITHHKLIESAPFYLRRSTSKNLTSTIEILNPIKISHKLNQFLLSSRKIYIIEDIKSQSDLSSYYSFQDICKNITWANGKSFYISSLVLPFEQRNNAYFIYTLCRIIDDATDEKNSFITNQKKGVNFSNQLLDILWSEDYEFPEEFISNLTNHISHCLFAVIDINSARNFMKQAKMLIESLNIEKCYFQELLEGQLMDENFSQPSTITEFNLYCYRVAGVVGIMMAKIFQTPENNAALFAAEKLGLAMQITNILRDVKEDYEMQRVYIPQSLFEKFQLDGSSLFSSNHIDIENKAKMVHELSNIAISYYRISLDGIKYIPSLRAKICVKLMIAVYGSILGRILIDKNIIFKKRVVISHFKKIIIFLKVIFGLHPLKVAKLLNEKDIYEKI